VLVVAVLGRVGCLKPFGAQPRGKHYHLTSSGMAMPEDLEFQEFFASQFSQLRRLGFWLTGNWGQAEELAQDALVRTYGRWRWVRSHDRPEDYARKVLLNRHRSLLRRAVVEARYRSRSRPQESAWLHPREDALVLWAATLKLPPRQREVLVLRYHEDLTEAAVARLLGVPVGTVKSLARRGLARLRRELAASDPDLVHARWERQP
jgi:RNA polymerase sigma-70 factor (sigma-E family)